MANVKDDDVHSVPDNISEAHVPQQPVSQPTSFNGYLNNGPGFEARNSTLQGLPNVFPQPAYPNGGLFDQAQQMQLQLLSQIAAQNGLAFPTQFMPRGHLQSGAFNLPSLNLGQQQPQTLHPRFLQNMVHRGTKGSSAHDTGHFGQTSTSNVPNTNGLEIQDEYILQKSTLKSTNKRSPPKERHTRLKTSPEHENHLNVSSVSQIWSSDIEHREETHLESEELFVEEEGEAEPWDEVADDSEEEDENESEEV